MGVTLNTMTKYVSMILTRIQNISIEGLEKWLNTNCDVWSYIVHDKDVYENGLLKDKHIHIVCEMKNSRQRLTTILSNISTVLNVNSISISIDKTQSTEGALQYLIHKNDKDKHEYNYNEIKTNMTKEDLLNYLSSDNVSLSFDRLLNICKDALGCKSRIKIIQQIGLGYYSKYRNVINDILEELMTIDRQKRLNEVVNRNCK